MCPLISSFLSNLTQKSPNHLSIRICSLGFLLIIIELKNTLHSYEAKAFAPLLSRILIQFITGVEFLHCGRFEAQIRKMEVYQIEHQAGLHMAGEMENGDCEYLIVP